MSFRSHALFLTLLLGAAQGSLACSPPAPADVQVSRADAPIINGTRERERKQVVLVTAGGAICTGALVADRVVLSAKHCIQQPGAAGPAAVNRVRVGVGSAAGGSGSDVTWFTVQSIITTPGTYSEGGLGVQELAGKDVSILTLTESVPDVAPLKLKLDDPSDQVGAPAIAVGFGQTPEGEVGIKYSVAATVESISEQTLRVDDAVCQGDSGGPLINERDEVFGVVSYGRSAGCGGGASYYQRIDIWADLIRDAIDKGAMCGENGAEACDGFDNDCDGQVDEDCRDAGEDCDSDVQCATRLCAATGKGKVCAERCDPLAGARCEAGFACVADDECKGVCLRGEAGDAGFGASCKKDSDCTSNVCRETPDGDSRCLVVCLGDQGNCLSAEACTASAGQCGACVADQSVDGTRGLDEGCDDDVQCRSKRCFDDGGTKYCAATCESDDDCDERHHCRQNVCARGPSQALGGRCSEHDDCADGFCAKTARGQFCTRVCSAASTCDDGFSCEQVNNGSACLPKRQMLGAACQADDDCASERCHEKSATCTSACASPNDCGVGLECVRVNHAGGLCLSPAARDAEVGGGDEPDAGTAAENDGDGSSCSLSQGVQSRGLGVMGTLSGLIALGVLRRRRRRP